MQLRCSLHFCPKQHDDEGTAWRHYAWIANPLRPGVEADLDRLLTNDTTVDALGVIYAWNEQYGLTSSEWQEFCLTLCTGDSNVAYVAAGVPVARNVPEVQTVQVIPAGRVGDFFAFVHSHPLDDPPTWTVDFRSQMDPDNRAGINYGWSIFVSPSKIYFTWPNVSQYCYLPTSAFTNTSRIIRVPPPPPAKG